MYLILGLFARKTCIIITTQSLSDSFPPPFLAPGLGKVILNLNHWPIFLKISKPSSIFIPHRTARKEFITAKYVDHKFSRKTCASAAAKLNELLEAVKSRDLLALIQVYAEGVELMEPLLEPGQVSLSGKQSRVF